MIGSVSKVSGRSATYPRRDTETLEVSMRPQLNPAQRFWAKVNKNGPLPDFAPHLGPCWLWTGATFPRGGYGQFRGRAGKTVRAHRFSYEFVIGPIPTGLQLDHLCRVHHCVNPAHLEPVTNRENILRGVLWCSAKTHCSAGHEYSVTNTYIRPNGHRVCKICKNAGWARWRAKARSMG